MSKPSKPAWLENWHVGPTGVRVEDERGALVLIDAPRDDGESLRLAAAAPAMVRVLLSVEWTCDAKDDGGDVWCPWCDGRHRAGDERDAIHQPPCWLDAALTSAGFPDQSSRDAARRDVSAAKNFRLTIGHEIDTSDVLDQALRERRERSRGDR